MAHGFVMERSIELRHLIAWIRLTTSEANAYRAMTVVAVVAVVAVAAPNNGQTIALAAPN